MIIGSGGREHAIAHALLRSPLVSRIFICPGNYGTHTLDAEGAGTTGATISRCENVPIAQDDIQRLVSFAKQQAVSLVVVGPEQPLVDGIADSLRSEV